jgi:hypothetical protein
MQHINDDRQNSAPLSSISSAHSPASSTVLLSPSEYLWRDDSAEDVKARLNLLRKLGRIWCPSHSVLSLLHYG